MQPAPRARLRPSSWRRDLRVEHRWHGEGGFVTDVLSATPELIAAGGIAFEGGCRVMSLVGYDLAFEHATVDCFLQDTTAAAIAAREAGLRAADAQERVLARVRAFELGLSATASVP